LLQTEPEIVDDLHERAADWYEKNGLIQKAVEHAFQVSNGNKLSRLIEKHALPVIYQGEVSTVIGWFDRLPAVLMQASPLMCISKAWSLALMYRQAARIEEVQQALQAAEEALTRIQADEPLRNLIAGHAATIQAFSMGPRNLTHEDAKDLIELAQNAQGLLPQDEKAIRSVNAMIMGNAYMALADLSAAELAFNQTFEDGIAGGNFYAAVYGPINSISIAMIRGQLKDAMHLCTTNIDRFNRLLAGQKFPAIGALYILKGCLLLEADHLSEAEQALTQGLSLVRWTGEFRTHIKGYSAQARLRAIQGDRAGMSESLKFLEETRPDFAFYAQDLHYRFSRHDLVASKLNFGEVQRWAIQEATRFRHISDLTGVTPWHEVRFQSYLAIAHGFLRVAAQNPKSYSLQDVHSYFARQEEFAKSHELTSWLIEIWILRALMYHVEGKKEEAQRVIQCALSESEPRGYFRIFLDESDLLRPLLESLVPYLNEDDLSAFVKHVLEAMPGGSVTSKADTAHEELLSDRELDVLCLLATGQSYKEIGKTLFLSLNTVQFHVKSIYRKLQVNKRVQAVEKAREMKLV
jgi:LuxR family maltose regulon positive regulatory protein